MHIDTPNLFLIRNELIEKYISENINKKDENVFNLKMLDCGSDSLILANKFGISGRTMLHKFDIAMNIFSGKVYKNRFESYYKNDTDLTYKSFERIDGACKTVNKRVWDILNEKSKIYSISRY